MDHALAVGMVALMTDSLFSESWYRVVHLKPRLRSHAEIHRHTYRGQDWYILQDHSSGRFHRFSPEAYHIIGLMDGKKSLGEIWQAACTALGDDMPTQGEVIQLISQLHQTDVLLTDIPPDMANLLMRFRHHKRARLLSQLGSPFAIRLPLFDPERFLAATQFLVRPLFGWVGLLLWLAVVGSAVLLAGVHWTELTGNVADRVLATENLMLLWLAYPLIKTLHEFGHAYAVRHWGGEVHEMGMMLLVFVPVPYVDASGATAFRKKHRRMMVGAAGIVTEIFLAAAAMWAWVLVEPGALRALAFNSMIIAGVSTLVFNGNPLLRFDAYYILSDFLEIPNLGTRSTRYLGYLCQRHLLKLTESRNPASSSAEARWLGFYGIAAFGYRMFIMVRIALFVAGQFFFLGVGLAVWGVFSMLFLPLFKVLKRVFTESSFRSKRRRAAGLVALTTVAVGMALLAVPVPSFTVVQGVLAAPPESRLHAGTDGFVQRIVASPGQRVRPGDPLVQLENPDLVTELAALDAELREYESRYHLGVTRDRTEARILTDEIERIRAELAEKRSEQDLLMVRSPAEGVFLLPDADNLLNMFVRRGMPIGHVVDFSKVTARIVVPQSRVDRIRRQSRSVSARIADAIDRQFPAVVKREVPAASSDLPSLALSLEGGGNLALDPMAREGAQAFEKLFHFEIGVLNTTPRAIGERVYVRFEHDPEPVAYRWYRNLRRTLLSNLNV